MSKRHTELIARGLITSRGRVLLCQNVKHGYFYLPGGHVEFGERAADALTREITEETGLESRAGRLLLAVETAFVQGGKDRHELSLVFHVEHLETPEGDPGQAGGQAGGPAPVHSLEAKIDFAWVELAALPETDLRPLPIKAWLVAGGSSGEGALWVSSFD